MWFGERVEVNFPNVSWSRQYGILSRKYWKSDLFGVSAGHGGDEYGNCSVYFACALFRIVVFPNTFHFQRKVECPPPGVHPFIDAMFWDDESVAYAKEAQWIRDFYGTPPT